jgi:histone H2B
MPKSVSSYSSESPKEKKEKKPPKKKKTVSKTLTPGKKGKRPKKKVETFALYIYKVLKQVHPEIGVSRKAMSILNSFVNDCYDRITKEASILVKWLNKRTMSSRYPYRLTIGRSRRP